MIKIGDYVTRKKYGNDIVFKVDNIINNKYILKGIDLRLYADAEYDDLILSTISKKKEKVEIIRDRDNNYFLLPGIIVHIDSDKDYLEKCMEYYKKQKLKCFGFIFKEKDYKENIDKIILKCNPNIIVLTGHDAYYKKNNTYKNSKYFIDAVKEIRKINKDVLIFAGACQSDFIGLIKSGATFASSPNHNNIHALDPAIIAANLALIENTSVVDIENIISKTKYGFDGIGGTKTFGTLVLGCPRKDYKIE